MSWAERASTRLVSGVNGLLEFVTARCALPPVFSCSRDNVFRTNDHVSGGVPFAGEVPESGLNIADARFEFSALAKWAIESDVSSARVLVVLVVVLAGPIIRFT